MPFIYKTGTDKVDLETLNTEELFDLIENIPCDSDDEFENSDEQEIIPVSEEQLEHYFERNDITKTTTVQLDQSVPEETIEQPSTSFAGPPIGICKPRDLLWKHRRMRNVPCAFTGTTTLPNSIVNLQTPFQFFKYFFDDALLDKIVEESRRYSIFQNPATPYSFSKTELMRYLGICIISSVVHVPNVRLYWHNVIGLDIIRNAMSQKTFEKIRSNLHFSDNSITTNDKLQKLRPIIDSLSSKFVSVSMEENLSIDEQICATKARHHLKQYLPLKPHKWGYKLFILSGVLGFCYKFEIYTGTENEPDKRLPDEPDLGASSNVVVRLARDIPPNCFHKLYFDNYYTSIPLISFLAKRGIHSLGTARRNRIPSCKIPTQSECKKLDRGEFNEFIADFDGTSISNVYWKDNKIVVLLSSFIGIEPIQKIQRYDRKCKERIQIPCPAVIKQYNKHMGGVDLLDSLIGKYRIKMRSRKWYMRLFYHLLDITIINAWLLYRRCNEGKPMTLPDFRFVLASTLCNTGSSGTAKRGRPSNLQQQINIKRKKPNVTPLPPQDVRLDNENHFPRWNETRLRCKFPNCKAQTYVVCEKCETSLCFNKDKNCFASFHKT